MKILYYIIIGKLFYKIIEFPAKLNLSNNDKKQLIEAMELYFDKVAKKIKPL